MISGDHQHKCRVCEKRFDCMVMTHCGLDSNDVQFTARPVCYSGECRAVLHSELDEMEQL